VSNATVVNSLMSDLVLIASLGGNPVSSAARTAFMWAQVSLNKGDLVQAESTCRNALQLIALTAVGTDVGQFAASSIRNAPPR
jgi:hypothetical protein